MTFWNIESIDSIESIGSVDSIDSIEFLNSIESIDYIESMESNPSVVYGSGFRYMKKILIATVALGLSLVGAPAFADAAG